MNHSPRSHNHPFFPTVLASSSLDATAAALLSARVRGLVKVPRRCGGRALLFQVDVGIVLGDGRGRLAAAAGLRGPRRGRRRRGRRHEALRLRLRLRVARSVGSCGHRGRGAT